MNLNFPIKTLFFVAATSIALSTCKKDEVEPLATPPEFYGVSELLGFTDYSIGSDTWQNNTSGHNYYITTAFSAEPYDGYTIQGRFINAGKITVNGDSLALDLPRWGYFYHNADYFYGHVKGDFSFPQVWNISGAGIIPPYNFINQDTFPEIVKAPIMNDTIYKSSDYTFTLPEVSGYDFVSVEVAGIHHVYVGDYPPSVKEVTLPVAATSSMRDSYSGGGIFLTFTKYRVESWGKGICQFKTSRRMLVGNYKLLP
jgi:hypothetical protein